MATDRARGVAAVLLVIARAAVGATDPVVGTGPAVARAGGGNNQCFSLPAQAWYN